MILNHSFANIKCKKFVNRRSCIHHDFEKFGRLKFRSKLLSINVYHAIISYFTLVSFDSHHAISSIPYTSIDLFHANILLCHIMQSFLHYISCNHSIVWYPAIIPLQHTCIMYSFHCFISCNHSFATYMYHAIIPLFHFLQSIVFVILSFNFCFTWISNWNWFKHIFSTICVFLYILLSFMKKTLTQFL